ncbi:MAG: hypothetical protein GEU88_16190, partial [Solirubrobacterales bacterium]|nr:hypothetical protein [Solirubrobacterales bacterium]
MPAPQPQITPQPQTEPADSTLRQRELLAELSQIERPSASDGERRAAEWIVARLAEAGAEARVEVEPAHGTYWWPLGLGAAAGAIAGLAALALVTAACGGDDDDDDGGDGGGETSLDLVVGDSVPLSGDLADFGPPGEKAADLAIEQINSAIE